MNALQIGGYSRFLLGLTLASCACLHFTALGAPTVLDTAINPANGHTYYLLSNSDWTNAENAAVALGGHLVTVRNLAENNWILNRWGTIRSIWIGLYDPVSGDGGGAQHAADFVWSSGDSSTNRNWRSGEPNGDLYTYMYALNQGSYAGQWNDIGEMTSPGGSESALYGVAEVNTCTPHPPLLQPSCITTLSWMPPSPITAAVIQTPH